MKQKINSQEEIIPKWNNNKWRQKEVLRKFISQTNSLKTIINSSIEAENFLSFLKLIMEKTIQVQKIFFVELKLCKVNDSKRYYRRNKQKCLKCCCCFVLGCFLWAKFILMRVTKLEYIIWRRSLLPPLWIFS